jgi:hypothetical protein
MTPMVKRKRNSAAGAWHLAAHHGTDIHAARVGERMKRACGNAAGQAKKNRSGKAAPVPWLQRCRDQNW